tara:strand:- start:43 stop:762 length:720 start_codon:yes stop_codon:yes gene_type:complete
MSSVLETVNIATTRNTEVNKAINDMPKAFAALYLSKSNKNKVEFGRYEEEQSKASVFYATLILLGVNFSIHNYVEHNTTVWSEGDYEDHFLQRYVVKEGEVRPCIFTIHNTGFKEYKNEQKELAQQLFIELGADPKKFITEVRKYLNSKEGYGDYIRKLKFEDFDFIIPPEVKKSYDESNEKIKLQKTLDETETKNKYSEIRLPDPIRKPVEQQKMSKGAKLVLAALVISGFIMAITNS